ncbi:HNH/endonuclease VII fold toxin-2 domain-containing protein [Flavobacterium sp. FlaQc-48]
MTKDGNCPGYKKGDAPTVCVEGTNNSNGTHGLMHDNLLKHINEHRAK